jgi:mannose-1-phosphate guanylyltransferase/mannose-6-phosphate isomerase
MQPDLSGIQPVILAGGAGRRLWPLSTAARPKPFLRLGGGGRSLLQATAARAAGMRPPVIVAAAAHRDLILADLAAAGAKPGRLLLEPAGRGTAPALAVAAHLCGHRDDPLLLVLPSDHRIDDHAAFVDAVARGAVHAAAGAIVTFGVRARRAETRYGYIRRGAALDDAAARIAGFVEKPPPARARDFLRDGDYLWNSGIFLMRARVALAALPAAVEAAAGHAVRRATARQESVILDPAAWADCPNISIDHAIMERTAAGIVVGVDMGWSDLGTWGALLGNMRR